MELKEVTPEKTCKTHECELDKLAGDEVPRDNVGCVILKPFAKGGCKRKCVSVIVSGTKTI